MHLPSPVSTLARLLPILGLCGLMGLASTAHAQGDAYVAVLEIGGELPEQQLYVITEEVRAGALDALAGEHYSVMTRENQVAIMSDMGLDLELCAAEANCEVDFGRNIGAALVVAGVVVEIEGVPQLTLKLFDTKHAKMLSQTRAKATNINDLIDKTKFSSHTMIARGLGLRLPDESRRSGESTTASASFSSGGFGTGMQMDVAAKLKEKRCGEAAEQQGAQVRSSKLAQAETSAKREATGAWRNLKSQATMCLELDHAERTECIEAVTGWIRAASSLSASIPAGTEEVETECGPREVVFDAVSKPITAAEMAEAQDLLERLKAKPKPPSTARMTKPTNTTAQTNSAQAQTVRTRAIMKASDFSREKLSPEYRRRAREKRHQEMDFAKEVLQSGRMTGETKAEMMLRLADLYFEEGRDLYLTEMDEYEKQFDTCFNNANCSTETMQPDNTNSHKWQEKSTKLYRQILRNYPQFQRADEALFYLASALQETGERKEGVEQFTRLIRSYPDSRYVPDAYVQVGEYYFDINNAYKALLAYQKAAAYRNSPKYAFAMYKLGWCYYNVGEYGKAIDTMKVVVDFVDPSTPKPSKAVASSRKKKRSGGQTSNSQDSVAPSNLTQLKSEALKDLIKFFADAGEMDEAYSYFNQRGNKEAIRQMLARLARTYFEQGKYEQCIQTYRRLIVEAPTATNAPEYQNEIIQAYAKMGRKRETIVEIDKLRTAYGPTSDWARQNAANRDAVKSSLDYIEKNLRTVATNYHGEARKLRTGRSAQEAYALAMKAYQDYLAEFPGSKYAYDMRYAFGELLYKIKRYDEAFQQYMAVVAIDPEGRHSQFCAESAIFAADKIVQNEGASAGSPGSGNKASPLPLSRWETNLLSAIDQYASLFPNDSKTQKFLLKAAYLLYNHNMLEQASDRFRQVIAINPGSEAARSSKLMMDKMRQ